MRKIVLVLILSAMGCSAKRAYPGPARSKEDVAVIYAARRVEVVGGLNEFVRLLALNGQSSVGEWNSNITAAEVLPGDYEVTVRYERKVASLVGLVLNLGRQTSPHTLRFSTKAGMTYAIYYAPDSDIYSVAELPIAVSPPQWDAPSGALPCEKQAESVSFCPTQR